jgi:simple sugar transport system permease protein/ribose transport system permease protein
MSNEEITKAAASQEKIKKPRGRALRFEEFGVLVVLVILFIAFTIMAPNTFPTAANLMNILRQITEVSIMAIGATFVIITAEIDLSPGSIYGFSGAVFALMMAGGTAPTLCFIAALAIATGIGLVSGTFVTRIGVPAFIITLCMSMIFRGGVYIATEGHQVVGIPKENWPFALFGSRLGDFRFPSQVIVMAALIIVFAIILKNTSLGFRTYATGGNIRAAEVSGINTKRVKLFAFGLAGGLAGLAGVVSVTYLGSLYPTAGSGYEMDVVAACILGGTNLAGGRGTILGTLIGAAIIGVIKNALVLMHVDAYFQTATVGVVILIGVCVDTMVKRRGDTRLA